MDKLTERSKKAAIFWIAGPALLLLAYFIPEIHHYGQHPNIRYALFPRWQTNFYSLDTLHVFTVHAAVVGAITAAIVRFKARGLTRSITLMGIGLVLWLLCLAEFRHGQYFALGVPVSKLFPMLTIGALSFSLHRARCPECRSARIFGGILASIAILVFLIGTFANFEWGTLGRYGPSFILKGAGDTLLYVMFTMCMVVLAGLGLTAANFGLLPNSSGLARVASWLIILGGSAAIILGLAAYFMGSSEMARSLDTYSMDFSLGTLQAVRLGHAAEMWVYQIFFSAAFFSGLIGLLARRKSTYTSEMREVARVHSDRETGPDEEATEGQAVQVGEMTRKDRGNRTATIEFCPYCGARIRACADSKFCMKCGRELP